MPMKITELLRRGVFLFVFSMLFSACIRDQDPGPLQADEKDYPLVDFDRLEMGDAFVITVQQRPVYSIHVRGDRTFQGNTEALVMADFCHLKAQSTRHSHLLTKFPTKCKGVSKGKTRNV